MASRGVFEFLIGGLATCGAGFFTNPLEVVKTRMQLQGELRAHGQYAVCFHFLSPVFYCFVILKFIIVLNTLLYL